MTGSTASEGGARGTSAAAAPARDLLVGREPERTALMRALEHAASGAGSTWTLTGPVGMGKTRLLRWLEAEAVRRGFATGWGSALRAELAPFFAFQQVFASLPDPPARLAAEKMRRDAASRGQPLWIVEEPRPELFWELVRGEAASRPLLALARDLPPAVRQRLESAPLVPSILRLSLQAGPGTINPALLDALAERCFTHLSQHPGGTVALTGFEYLTSQHGFLPALRWVQAVRDEATHVSGRVVLALNPAALEPREVKLLESEGEVLSPAGGPRTDPTKLPPSLAMLGFLDELEERCAQRPHLLVLDDLPWADLASLRLFAFLARNLARLPVVLVASVRTGEEASLSEATREALEEALHKLPGEGLVRNLPLGPISLRDASALLEGVAGAPLAPGSSSEVLEELLGWTGGNPYFLREALGQWKESGRLRLAEEGARLDGTRGARGARAAVPSTLRRLLERRLAAITGPDRALLAAAAVQGVRFEEEPLGAVRGRTAEEVRSSLEQMAHRHGVFDEDRTTPRAWRFVHGLIWEATLDQVAPSERRQLAGRLARWWSEERPREVRQIARLMRDAEETGTGPAWVLQAIDLAMWEHAPDEVELYHQWLQELWQRAGRPIEERTAQGLELLLRLVRSLGSSPGALRLARYLEGMHPPPALQHEVEGALVTVLRFFEPKEARRRLEQLEEEVRHGVWVPPAWMQANLLLARAGYHMREADFDRARSASLAALELCQGAPEDERWDGIRVLANYNAGWALKELGRVPEALARLEEAQRTAARGGAPRLQSYCVVLQAALCEARGDLVGCEEAFDRAQQLDRKIGTVTALVVDLLNLGETQARRGRFAAAWSAEAEAKKLSERFGYRVGTLGAGRLRGDLRVREGRFREALEEYRTVRTGYREIGHRDMEAASTLGLIESAARAGDVAVAAEEMGAFGPLEEALPLVLRAVLPRIRAEVLLAQGDREGSTRALDEAERATAGGGYGYERAWVLEARSRWEVAFGTPEGSARRAREAEELFERCGVARAGAGAATAGAPPPGGAATP